MADFMAAVDQGTTRSGSSATPRDLASRVADCARMYFVSAFFGLFARTGVPMPGQWSSACPGSTPARTWPARRSRRSLPDPRRGRGDDQGLRRPRGHTAGGRRRDRQRAVRTLASQRVRMSRCRRRYPWSHSFLTPEAGHLGSGAKQGANAARNRATLGYDQRRLPQLSGI